MEASIDLNLQDANGEAALHVAAVDTGDSAFVEFLVNAGADVNIKVRLRVAAWCPGADA